METNQNLYIGIDLGGTYIKGAVVSADGKIVHFGTLPTEAHLGKDKVVDNILSLINILLQNTNLPLNSILGIGIGVPGVVNRELGQVLCSHALKFYNFDLAKIIEDELNIKVKLCNDADAAMLGERSFGTCQGMENALLITIGTGIGGSAIVNGKLLTGENGCGGEFGHEVIVMNGKKCSCGRRGCFQAYASAKAFEQQILETLKLHPDSKMLQDNKLRKINAKTAFDYYLKDHYAKDLVNRYVSFLATGITNFVNIFRPQIVVLAGGITAQGDKLTKPLQKLVNKQVFDVSHLSQVEIVVSRLSNPAVLGAVSLFLE